MKFSPSYIREHSQSTGFDAENLEKVLRLKQLLSEISLHPYLRDKLVLKGGTALNLFYLNLSRLSVDIDLNYVGQIDREAMLSERPQLERAITQVCSSLGYQIQQGENGYALFQLYLGFTSHTDRSDNIGVDVNFLMRVCTLPPNATEAGQLADERACRFSVLAIEELMAGKITAMLDRRHPRDLYDLYRFASANMNHDSDLLRKVAVLLGSTLPRDLRDYTWERIETVDQMDVESLLYPLLRADDRPKASEMTTAIKSLVVPILEHDRESPFLDAIAQGEYRPDLLFSHLPEIAARLARHPALLWKASSVAAHLAGKKEPR